MVFHNQLINQKIKEVVSSFCGLLQMVKNGQNCDNFGPIRSLRIHLQWISIQKGYFRFEIGFKVVSRGKKWSKPWLDSGLKFLPGWNLVVKRVIQSLSVRNRIRVASLGSFIEGCLFRIVELEKVVARTQLSLWGFPALSLRHKETIRTAVDHALPRRTDFLTAVNQ